MNQTFDQNDLIQIRNLLESNATDAIYSGAIKRLNELNAYVSKKMTELYQAAAGRMALQNAKLESYRLKEREAIVSGNFKESGLDSVDVARALLHCMKLYGMKYTTKSKLVAVLYQAYSTWLGTQGQRLFMEHPCHTEWGPQFWRVYNRIDLKEDRAGLHAAYLAIGAESAGIARFLSNVAAKYHDCREEDMQKVFIQSKPFQMSLPERNNGKKNAEIKDTEIYEWKKNKNTTNKTQ